MQTIISIFAGVLLIMLFVLSTMSYENRVTVRGKTYTVEVSDTYFTQSKGLSGKKSLSNDEGMIFVFENPYKYGFWMKEMNFPIDIIWIDENKTVNHIEKDVKPETYPKIFYPETPSKYVLEIASGQSDLHGIKVGDTVDFLYKNRI